MKNVTKAMIEQKVIQNAAAQNAAMRQAVKLSGRQKMSALLWGTSWKGRAVRLGALGGAVALVLMGRWIEVEWQRVERESAEQRRQERIEAERRLKEEERLNEEERRLEAVERKKRALKFKRNLKSIAKLQGKDEVIAKINDLNLAELALKGHDSVVWYDDDKRYIPSGLRNRMYNGHHMTVVYRKARTIFDVYCLISEVFYMHGIRYKAVIGKKIQHNHVDELDIIGALLQKINWIDDMEIIVRNVNRERGEEYAQMAQNLLQSNSGMLKKLRLKYALDMYSERDRNEWQGLMRYLEMCLDFCLEDKNMKNLQKIDFSAIIDEMLIDTKWSYRDGDKVILNRVIAKLHKFVIRAICQRKEVEQLNTIKRLLQREDIVRYKEKKLKGQELKASYTKTMWIAQVYAEAKRRVMIVGQRIKQRQEAIESIKQSQAIAKLFRSEIVAEIVQQACGAPRLKPLTQFDFKLLYGCVVSQSIDGLSISDYNNIHYGTLARTLPLFGEAFLKCQGVSECSFDIVAMGSLAKEGFVQFLNNNADSLRRLDFPGQFSNENAMGILDIMMKSPVLPNLTECTMNTESRGRLTHEGEGVIIYNFIERNKNLCIFEGVNNIQSESMRQRIWDLLNERAAAKRGAIE